MATDLPVELVSQQDWLEPIAERVQPAIAAALDDPIGTKVANILHGTWLGHPLHVVLTDVPLGCWTAAAVCDTLEIAGRSSFRRSADRVIKLGLVGAAGAAVTGLADWSRIGGGEARRIGSPMDYSTSRLRPATLRRCACGAIISGGPGGNLLLLDYYFSRRGLSGRTPRIQKKARCRPYGDYPPPQDFIPVLAETNCLKMN